MAERRLRIPPPIERSVLRQNVEFMHIRSHFSLEYFQFIRRLVSCNHFTVAGMELCQMVVSFMT